MAEVFFISDTHFGHANILKFKHDGKPLRPFVDLEDMHNTMVENWNSVVTPRDKVYHLGDVAMGQRGLHILDELNGKKRLIRGNHDTLSMAAYKQYFVEIYGVRQFDGFWFTHIPIHESCMASPRAKANVHGHLHAHKIDHPKYINVSVECINYTPVSFDWLKEQINENNKNE